VEIKEPIIEEEKGFNFFTSIWIVPIIALIIALWLTYEHFSKLGPEIKIEFKDSGGLVAGESVLKFRDVPVGKVTKIEINSKKNDGVIVYVRVDKGVEPFLNDSAKFWIVKPEVSYTGVSGLDTLLKGSYIKMYANKEDTPKREFIGSNHPFVDLNSAYYYVLEADFELKIKKETPIYFKGIKIGEVDSVTLNYNNKKPIVMIRIFKEYKDFINESSKFWIQSLLDLKLSDNRLEVKMSPLPMMILGGISVDTDFSKKYNPGFYKIFKLYKNVSEAKSRKIGYRKSKKIKSIFNFVGNVSSLEEGTKIKYKGFDIGEIKKLKISYNKEYKGFEAKCIGEIDVSNFSTKNSDGLNNFKELLKSGIIAKMEKSNPLFNKSNIILTEDNSTKETVKIDKLTKAYIIPTKKYEEQGIISKLSQISDKLNKIDYNNINEMLKHAKKLVITTNEAVKNINSVIKSKEFKSLTSNINSTLKSLKQTLLQTQKAIKQYGGNSLFADKVEATLKDLHNSAEQTNRLLQKLNNKPNALIFGE